VIDCLPRRPSNGPQPLIVDELGCLPLPAEAARHLFQVVSRRYEHGSIILTSNRGIASWGEIFDDNTVAAILDRLLHHGSALTVNGPSYRMCRHHEHLGGRRERAAQRRNQRLVTRNRRSQGPQNASQRLESGRPRETGPIGLT
jgi:hypothetical protein